MGDAGFDRLARHLPSVAVEEGKFSTGFGKPPLQIPPLRLGWPHRSRITAGIINAMGEAEVRSRAASCLRIMIPPRPVNDD